MEVPGFARSQKLQEHIWEQDRTLTPGMSLRLKVALAACLRDQRSESESVMAVPLIYVERSTAADHEIFEDTDWELQDLVRLEMQRVSSFGSASSYWTRRGSGVASVSTP